MDQAFLKWDPFCPTRITTPFTGNRKRAAMEEGDREGKGEGEGEGQLRGPGNAMRITSEVCNV